MEMCRQTIKRKIFTDFPEAERLVLSHVAIPEGEIIYFNGIELEINPHVFSPNLSNTSKFLVDNIYAADGSRFLEVGIGSGFTLISIGKRYCNIKLFGTDINPHAVGLAKRNLKRHGLDAKIWRGNLFQCIFPHTYDSIVFNPPLLILKEEIKLSYLEKSIFDANRTTKSFLSQVGKYMHDDTNGFLLATNRQNVRCSKHSEIFEKWLHESAFCYKPISFFDVGYEIYSVYQFRKKNNERNKI